LEKIFTFVDNKHLTMNKFEIEGRLVVKYDTQKKTETFSTREFVIETLETYPQFIKFQMTQDKCALLDDYAENSMVKVNFDIRGREWQGKYLTNLNAWRLEKVGSNAAPTAEAMPVDEAFGGNFPSLEDEPQNGGDDLPF
jgi:hypothetical protein